MKKLIPLLTAAIMLTACINENNTHTQDAEADTAKVSVSQAWEGWEELQGKSFGNAFTMPEKLDPVIADELYSFEMLPRTDFDSEAEAKKYFKLVFGDEKNIVMQETENGDHYHYSVGENDSIFSDFSYGTPVNFGSKDNGMLGNNGYRLRSRYSCEADRDVMLEIGTENLTVGQAGEAAAGYCKRLLDGHFTELELFPFRVDLCYNADKDDYAASVVLGWKYKGTVIEVSDTYLEDVETRDFYDVFTAYCPIYLFLDLYGSDDARFMMTACADKDIAAEKLDKIIPLKEAVALMEKELARYSGYKFSKVQLIYCNKHSYPVMGPDSGENESILADYGEVKNTPYVPTWVFTVGDELSVNDLFYSVKVNAVTGEITVDKGA